MKTSRYRLFSVKSILQKKDSMKKFRYTFMLLMAAFVMVSCGDDSEESFGDQSRPVPAVEAVKAQFGSLPLEERLSGTVRAGNQVEIFPRITAPIEDVYVESGDQVQQGDALV